MTHKRSERTPNIRPLQWPSIAFFLVLAGSLFHLLGFHQYPLLSAEVAFLLLAFALASGLFALLYRFSPAVLRAVLTGLLAYLAIDLHFDIGWWGIVAGVATAIVSLATKGEPLRFLAVIFAVVALWAILGLSESRPYDRTVKGGNGATPSADPDLPAIVHLILDEHGGGADLARLSRVQPGLDQEVLGRYRDMGFDVWPAAYSSDFYTMFAVPDMFGEAEGRYENARDSGRTARPMALLDLLSGRGHSLHFWQTDFLDLCTPSPAQSCRSQWTFSLRPLADSDLPLVERSALIAYNLFHSAALGRLATGWASDLAAMLGREPWKTQPLARQHRFSHLAGLELWDRLDDRLERLRPGEAVFAHILFPHYPYATNGNCELLPPARWIERVNGGSKRERIAAYADQLDCTAERVRRTIAAIEKSEARDNHILVIHGDHGSRLMDRYNFNDPDVPVTEDDLLAAHSALFAVRRSADRGRCMTAQASIEDLLGQLYGGKPLPAQRPPVLLGDRRKMAPKTRMLPDWPAQCDDKNGLAVVKAAETMPGEGTE